jgi:trehalose synthase
VDEVVISQASPAKFDPLIGPARATEFAAALDKAHRRLQGRTLWCVNSTAQGGGVAEMLSSILGYVAGHVRTRWMVLEGDDDFFEVTKRLHHLLHGDPGDGLGLGDRERAIYEGAVTSDCRELLKLVAPGDPVVLHDPQTLGLLPTLVERGAFTIWSCHIGTDEPNESTRRGWDFLRGYLDPAGAYVFSRPQYAWDDLDPKRVAVIPPCVDAFSPKNQYLAADQAAAILDACGLIKAPTRAQPSFARQDGSESVVSHRADTWEDAELAPDTQIITQISRWDPLKDHLGVMRAFADHVPPDLMAHLVLAGPAPDSVADDPEGISTFQDLTAAWEALPAQVRSRVHIACLPMDDPEQNGAIVNALQRRSDVVVQKSLAEGFGLTVAEAMLKGRPTVGTRVGGIQDQICHGRTGLLVDDPSDLAGFGQLVTDLLHDPDRAERLGKAAVDTVLNDYLAPHHLTSYLRLIGRVVTEPASAR